MIQEFVQLWHEPVEVLLDSADHVMENHFSALYNRHFRNYKALRSRVKYAPPHNGYMLTFDPFLHRAILNRHRLACGKLARDRVNWILEVERQATFTLNELYHVSYREKFAAFYKAVRRVHVAGCIIQHSPGTTAAERPTEDRWRQRETVETESVCTEEDPTLHTGVRPSEIETDDQKLEQLVRQFMSGFFPTNMEELIKLIPPSSSDQAIEIFADVRAYWQGALNYLGLGTFLFAHFSLGVVAFKRCVDYIPLAIDMELVRGFGRNISGLLFQELGVSGADAEEKCAKYLAEPPELAAKREDLQNKLRGLEDARDVIEDWRMNGV